MLAIVAVINSELPCYLLGIAHVTREDANFYRKNTEVANTDFRVWRLKISIESIPSGHVFATVKEAEQRLWWWTGKRVTAGLAWRCRQ